MGMQQSRPDVCSLANRARARRARHCKSVKKAVLLGVLAALALTGAQAQQLLAPPRLRPDALMQSITAEVTAILRRDLAAAQPTDIARLVETRIVPVFDFQRMTSIAVARNWQLASTEQQAALVTQFRTLLVRTYSRALESYRDQEITYRPLHADAGDTEVVVRSFVRRAGTAPLSIDYEMADGAAGWKVYDVKVAGVSLVITYRDSFAAAVRADGIDGLIKQLSDKNRQNESSVPMSGGLTSRRPAPARSRSA
jgi:phospholipid transport system substrate-binding protein